jgi:hypothetical protein
VILTLSTVQLRNQVESTAYIRITNKDDANHVGLICERRYDEFGVKLIGEFIYNADLAGGY